VNNNLSRIPLTMAIPGGPSKTWEPRRDRARQPSSPVRRSGNPILEQTAQEVQFSTRPPRSLVTSTLRDDAEERIEHPVEVLGNVFPEEPQNQYCMFLKQAVPALIAPVLQRGVDETAAVASRGVDRTGALDGDCVHAEQDDEVTKDAIRISTA